MLIFGLIIALGFTGTLVWRFRHDLHIPGWAPAEAMATRARGPLGRVLEWIRAHVRGSAVPPPVAAVVAQYVATRAIPSVMEDPALGAPAEPADAVPSGVPVPAPWAALAAYIRDREPADDQELRMFSDGDAAGALAVADAQHAYADTCLTGLRLSPAYVAGVIEVGDHAAEHASLLAQVHKRFGVIYGAIKEWIGVHGPLPVKGDFLTEDGI
jgi:hypothetical protein